ncbi:ABC transporter substrate-binding protein [Actinoallomurus acaciae]|uniref:ABC transporter substrate-binding protein n=1 Tax=Actinoallomurus acaciae TaxID=502577 RepID=A0ABV5YVY2_9ACTN
MTRHHRSGARTAERVVRAAAALAVLLGVILATTPAPSALAIDSSKGKPGFCKTGTGVTVVVDFQQLGGTTIVRCDPQSTRGTGLDALKNAGFEIAGVQRWGEAFICRIENRPSAAEKIPVKGNESYRELCVNTPPAAAYWSYWHAGNDCAWTYSQWGVKNRDFTPGGFEGWSFSLNATADTNPKPRIAAVRPGTEGGACTTAPEPAPAGNDPNAAQPGSTGDHTGGASGTGQPGTSSGRRPASGRSSTAGDGGSGRPPPRPRTGSTADDPAHNAAWTGGQNLPPVERLIKKQSGASDRAPWVAAAAIVVLGAGTGLTAWRRRRARES